MSLLTRIRSLFRRSPAPVDSNIDLVESLMAEAAAFHADKVRRGAAIDAAFDRAHRHAMTDDRKLRTAYQRKAGRLRTLK